MLTPTLCCTGQFVISMFVFVNKLSFTLSCLASIFFYIGKEVPKTLTPLLVIEMRIEQTYKSLALKGRDAALTQ